MTFAVNRCCGTPTLSALFLFRSATATTSKNSGSDESAWKTPPPTVPQPSNTTRRRRVASQSVISSSAPGPISVVKFDPGAVIEKLRPHSSANRTAFSCTTLLPTRRAVSQLALAKRRGRESSAFGSDSYKPATSLTRTASPFSRCARNDRGQIRSTPAKQRRLARCIHSDESGDHNDRLEKMLTYLLGVDIDRFSVERFTRGS